MGSELIIIVFMLLLVHFGYRSLSVGTVHIGTGGWIKIQKPRALRTFGYSIMGGSVLLCLPLVYNFFTNQPAITGIWACLGSLGLFTILGGIALSIIFQAVDNDV